jgi:hypothetical protein
MPAKEQAQLERQKRPSTWSFNKAGIFRNENSLKK